VSLRARAGTGLAPDAKELINDVTGMLGAVLRNALLTTQLKEQVIELRRSRQRLVEADDSALRGLERDLHDGAQARLVALRMGVAMSSTELDEVADAQLRDRLKENLEQLGTEVDEATRELRVFTHGLRPPVLESDGVLAALRAATRGLPVSVDLAGGASIGRLSPAVEAAVSLACLEAINNASTLAGADHVRAGRCRSGEVLRF